VRSRCFFEGDWVRWQICLGLCLCAAAQLTAPTCARAAETERSFFERTRGHLQLGLSGRADVASAVTVLSGVLSIDHAFSHGFGIGFDWGFFLANEAAMTADKERWATGPGNPWLKLWYEGELSPDTHWSVAAGATVPAAWLPRDTTRRAMLRDGYAFGAATRGLWNAWLWAPQQIAFAVAGRISHQLSARFRTGVEAGLAGSLSMGNVTRDAGALYAQLAPLIEARAALLTFGARLQAVLSDASPDPLQLSAQAYVRIERAHWQLEAAGLCNLDEPLGVLGSGLSVCAALLALGVQP
jgi:hypothetical protein